MNCSVVDFKIVYQPLSELFSGVSLVFGCLSSHGSSRRIEIANSRFSCSIRVSNAAACVFTRSPRAGNALMKASTLARPQHQYETSTFALQNRHGAARRRLIAF